MVCRGEGASDFFREDCCNGGIDEEVVQQAGDEGACCLCAGYDEGAGFLDELRVSDAVFLFEIALQVGDTIILSGKE